MKFIRDIVDSQKRFQDTDAIETRTPTETSSTSQVASDHPYEHGDVVNASPEPFARNFNMASAGLPRAEDEPEFGVQSETPTGSRDSIGLLDDDAPVEVDLGKPPSSEPMPSALPRETVEAPSRKRPVDDLAEPVSPQRPMQAHNPMTDRSTPHELAQPGELPLPLRERSGAHETVGQSDGVANEQSAVNQTGLRDEDAGDLFVNVPAPEVGRATSRGSRAKTRLLGFHPAAARTDPMARLEKTDDLQSKRFPVGWLVVTSGPGRGTQFTIEAGVAQIGRAEGQTIRLDFGDTSISRENHAAIAYDSEQNAFFVGHGGKANLVRRNDRPVLSTEELVAGDRIRVGETTLRFVPLCGTDFSWDEPQQLRRNHAVRG